MNKIIVIYLSVLMVGSAIIQTEYTLFPSIAESVKDYEGPYNATDHDDVVSPDNSKDVSPIVDIFANRIPMIENTTNDSCSVAPPPDSDGIFKTKPWTNETDNKDSGNDTSSNSSLSSDKTNNTIGGGILSFNSPQMEMDDILTSSPSDTTDSWIHIYITITYIDETSLNIEHTLNYTLFEVKEGDTIRRQAYTGGTYPDCGKASVWIACSSGGSKDLKFKVYMDDGRGDDEATGYVTNNGGTSADRYYGISSSARTYSDNKYYNVVLQFKDKGSGESFVGAAAIYESAQKSRAFIRGITADSYVNVKIKWDTGLEDHYLWDEERIEIGSGALADDYSAGWENYKAYDTLRHEYGHRIFDKIGYEGKWRPDGSDWSFYGSYTESGAYVEAFACVFSMAVIDIDVFLSNNEHIETINWNDVIGGALYGEKVPGCLICMLWDIVDSTSTQDLSIGTDDDSLASFYNFWLIVDDYEPQNSNQFWDYWQQNTILYDDELESIYLANNLARFTYDEYIGPSETNSDYFKVMDLQLRGMNVGMLQDQKVLVRYTLKNVGTTTKTFDATYGILIAARYPPGGEGQNCDFGYSHKGGQLGAGASIVITRIKTLDESSQGQSYYFWAWYVLQGGSQGGFSNHKLIEADWGSVRCYSFEDTSWPADLSRGDLTSTNGVDFWGLSSSQHYGQSTKSAWCIGSDSYPYATSGKYDNYQDSWMKLSGDFRYINLRITFYYIQAIEDYYDWLELQYNDGSSWITAQSYTADVGTWTQVDYTFTDGWIYKGGTNMQIRILFHSDYSVTDTGTYIDDLILFG